MDKDLEAGITTVAEIHMKMSELDPTEDKIHTYTRRYLKKKLMECYGESIYFTSSDGREDVVCLKDTTNAILREYRTKINDTSNELNDSQLKSLTISTAISLILGDLARVPLATKEYPSIESIRNTQNQLTLIPDSLQQLLKPIVKTDKKVAIWGQNLLKAYRPRSGVMPSQLGFAIQLENKFGSKWLIDHCHCLGYSESYAELHRYKYCYLNMKNGVSTMNDNSAITGEDEPINIVTEESEINAMLFSDQLKDQEENADADEDMVGKSYTNSGLDTRVDSTVQQYVGDNIDLNIMLLNGNTAFHAMGVIRITSPAPANRHEDLIRIPRKNLTVSEKAAVLKAADVKIQTYHVNKKAGLAELKLIPITDLRYEPPAILPEEICWTLGWVFKNHNPAFEHSNWNGFMKSIYEPHHTQKSLIEFLPIIEGDPNDYSTIYTTLIECLRRSKSPAIVTFDLPIWMKATQIVMQSDLPIITRLGGFHLLKSFLGSIGVIMADSGLHEVIQLVYPGSNTAEHILSGGAYAKAIRFHLLTSAAIIKFLLTDEHFTDQDFDEMERYIMTVKDTRNGNF